MRAPAPWDRRFFAFSEPNFRNLEFVNQPLTMHWEKLA